MTHDSHTLVMCCALGGGGLWGTSPAPPAEDLFWLAHRGCQCRFFSLPVGILFIYLFFRSSRQKNQFCTHLSGRPLMVFDGLGEGVGECGGIEQVLQSFVNRVLECFVPFSPLSLGDPWAGWHSAPRNHLCSASSVRDSPALFLSLLFSSSWCQNRYLACLLLSLIQFLLPHIFFARLPPHLHM